MKNPKFIVMLFDMYQEACRQLILKIVNAQKSGDAVEEAKQTFLLAMLRVQYYEQFPGTMPAHSKSAKYIEDQITINWRLVGKARDEADDAGFDWRSCEVPELAAYINAKPQ